MKALISASNLSVEQKIQLLINYEFILLLFLPQPAVKVTVRLSSTEMFSV